MPGVSSSEFNALLTETESMMSGTISVLAGPRQSTMSQFSSDVSVTAVRIWNYASLFWESAKSRGGMIRRGEKRRVESKMYFLASIPKVLGVCLFGQRSSPLQGNCLGRFPSRTRHWHPLFESHTSRNFDFSWPILPPSI